MADLHHTRRETGRPRCPVQKLHHRSFQETWDGESSLLAQNGGPERRKKHLGLFARSQSKDAAKASFDSFRQDADWVKAKTDSERNGPLTVQNGGVKSEFLVPTD